MRRSASGDVCPSRASISASIPSASSPERRDALPDRGELRLEPIAFALARGDRPLQRLDLDAAPDGLLARSPAELVDLASVLIGVPEGRLRGFELALPFGELLDRPFEVRLDARELRVDRVEPSRAARLGRECLPRRALSFERAPERLLRLCPVRLCVSEPELDVGEPAGRGGPGIGAGQHLAVQRIEPGAGLLPSRQSLVPAAAPPLALGEQTAQSSGRELPGELLRLRGQRLVLLRHLRLLSERLQLSAELRHHVLQAKEVVVQGAELALRPFLAPAMLRDARRFLDVLPTLLRPGEQHLLELALTDDRVQGPADARIR